jgi:WD40 repeat protein
LWDLRQQQCIHVFEVHDDGVWSVAVDPSFTNVYSGNDTFDNIN